MFRTIYSYIFGNSVTELSLDDVCAILEATNNESCTELVQATEAENATFHRTGLITFKEGHTYTIDDFHHYESNTLNANKGDKVSYILYVSDKKLHVADVNILENDWGPSWDDTQSTWYMRSLVCKVVDRHFREITVEPGALIIDLNNVRSDFIPLVGDWLQVEAKCELDEKVNDLTGKILEVLRITPLRVKEIIGVVKRWDTTSGTGVIDRNVFFDIDALNCGYMPRVADKIVAEVIESNQGFCDWRAIKVIPHLILKTEGELPKINEPFVGDAEGIEITKDIRVYCDKPDEITVFSVDVINKSDNDVVLKNIEFLDKNGQCKVENNHTYTDQVLSPGSSLIITCKCTPRNYGRSKELLLFTFQSYKINRYINIILQTRQTYSNNKNTKHCSILADREHHYRNMKRYDFIPGQNNIQVPRFVSKKIGLYMIPDKLWDLYLTFPSKASFTEELLKMKPCLYNLNYHCYEDYFHTLLHMEEMENVVAMRKFDRERTCFIQNGEYLMLEIENLSESRPSIIVCDKILARDPFNSKSKEFEGIVHKVSAKHVYLKFCTIFHESYKGEDYSVRVVSSRAHIRKIHHAVALALRNLGRELLFPSKIETKIPQFKIANEETDVKYNDRNEEAKPKMVIEEKKNLESACSKLVLSKQGKNIKKSAVENSIPTPRTVKIQWYDKTLNCYQKQAIRNILLAEAKPLPHFIFGPPGTGKTVTIVETILQIITLQPEARILVGTPSNSAANVIALRLIDSNILKPGDLIRFVAHKCITDDSLPLKLIPYCATADIATEGTQHQRTHVTLKNGLTLGVSCSVIGRHRITVSTCANLGTLFYMNFPKGHFTHVVIDEAGHLIEPEAMIPLSFLDVSSGQAILAGDPLQLGPTITSRVAAECGLAESYLERLINRFPYARDPVGFPKSGGYDPRLVTKLVHNYRSLPDILAVPDKLFYKSELRATISVTDSPEAKLLESVKEILPHVEGKAISSMIFHGVEGENYQMPDSPSWFNPVEASQIFLYVNDLYRLGIKAEDIGIISPYSKQVQQIRSILIEAEFDLPKIGTVDEFQGQEFKIVLLSMVRSQNTFATDEISHFLSFVLCPRRMNVAITRAQALLIIIGDPNMFGADVHWRNVLAYCVERGAYCGCPFNL